MTSGNGTKRRRKAAKTSAGSAHATKGKTPASKARPQKSSAVKPSAAASNRRAEAAGQASLGRGFEHALELAPVLVRKPSGEILLWGKGLQALYGFEPGEALGRNTGQLLATEFPLPLADIEAVLAETGAWQGELVRKHRDGRRVVVSSQWALDRRGPRGEMAVVEFDSDLTEAKRVQAMLADREARLRSLVETAPDAVITIDQHGIIQSFSEAAVRLFGYAAGEIIGRNVKILMPPPHRDSHDSYIARYLQTGQKRIIGIGRQVEAQRKDGSVFPMQIAVGEVVLGETHIFSAFISDLTARVKMEQELRHAQKMEAIGQLTGGVAHDFNNLLTIISGNLELLETRLRDPEELEILSEAQEASKLGAELTKRLLAFGRRQPLHPKPVEINALVERLAELLRRTLGEAAVVVTRLADGLPMILADPGQIENALLNLAINARDAMPGGGRLTIETSRAVIDQDYASAYPDLLPGKFVTISVTDTGTGMSPEVRQRAFEPFFTTKGAGTGSGLGLSMVYGFVKQSGGHIQLYSEPGFGTTVRLYLPGDGPAAGVEDRPAEPVARAVQGGRILLVEDDKRVRRVSVRRLMELGYSVIEAENGPQALHVLEGGEPVDVLFTDIVMPGGMTGLDLARAAREKRSSLKVLLTSGYAEPAALREGMPAANVEWLGKPYSMAELEAKLCRLLAS